MLIDEVNKHPDTNGILLTDIHEQLLKRGIRRFSSINKSSVAAHIALEADEIFSTLIRKRKNKR
jgi:hypothetical protein